MLSVSQLWPQIVEEAGGVVSRMDGGPSSVFDRSVLVASAALHSQVRDRAGVLLLVQDAKSSRDIISRQAECGSGCFADSGGHASSNREAYGRWIRLESVVQARGLPVFIGDCSLNSKARDILNPATSFPRRSECTIRRWRLDQGHGRCTTLASQYMYVFCTIFSSQWWS